MNQMLKSSEARSCHKDKVEERQGGTTKDAEREPKLRNEFVKRMEQIKRQKSIVIKDLAKRYGIKKKYVKRRAVG